MGCGVWGEQLISNFAITTTQQTTQQRNKPLSLISFQLPHWPTPNTPTVRQSIHSLYVLRTRRHGARSTERTRRRWAHGHPRLARSTSTESSVTSRLLYSIDCPLTHIHTYIHTYIVTYIHQKYMQVPFTHTSATHPRTHIAIQTHPIQS